MQLLGILSILPALSILTITAVHYYNELWPQ
jgi:hypothetical protein